MQWPGCRALLPAWRVFWALSPARLFSPSLLPPPLNSVLPAGAWRGRMAPSLPAGSSKFLSKGYLCKRCLVPSPQPRRLEPSLLNGASAEPRSSNARRYGGDSAPRCRRSSAGAPRSARTPVIPCDAGAAGIGGMLCRRCCTSLLVCSSLEAWKYGYVQATALRRAVGIAPGLQPLQPPRCLFHQARHLVLREPPR